AAKRSSRRSSLAAGITGTLPPPLAGGGKIFERSEKSLGEGAGDARRMSEKRCFPLPRPNASRFRAPSPLGGGKQGQRTSLLRRFQRFGRAVARGLDLGGLFFAQLDHMVDQVGVVDAIGRRTVEIDLPVALAGAAAGEPQIGLARLAGTVDDAADDRQ